MNTSHIRAVLHFDRNKVAIVLPTNLEEKELIQKCLEGFKFDPKQWDSYEVILLKIGCKMTSSHLLRFEDEPLLLRNKKFKQISPQISKDPGHNKQEECELQINAVLEGDVSYNSEILEIQTSKDKYEEEESTNYNLFESNDGIEVNSLGREDEEKDLENVVINLKEIESQKFINREDLKNKIIKLWGGKNKMNLNFRSQERTLIKNNIKVSIILCSKKDMFQCPFFRIQNRS